MTGQDIYKFIRKKSWILFCFEVNVLKFEIWKKTFENPREFWNFVL